MTGPDQAGSASGEAWRLDEYHIDSEYLLAFQMARDAFKLGVKGAGDLNVTQYRTLLGLLPAHEEGISQTELGRALDIRPNALSASLKHLGGLGLAARAGDHEDARVSLVRATPAGIQRVQEVNDAVAEQLYRIFPTDNDVYRAALESLILSAPTEFIRASDSALHYSSSYTLAVVERFMLQLESALDRTCSLNLTQSRVLQLLAETGVPARLGSLGEQLQMDASAMSRCARSLADKGLAVRLADPSNRRSVYLGLTEEGRDAASQVDRMVNEVAWTFFWSRLTPEQSRANVELGHVMLEDYRRRKALERTEALRGLVPLDQ